MDYFSFVGIRVFYVIKKTLMNSECYILFVLNMVNVCWYRIIVFVLILYIP